MAEISATLQDNSTSMTADVQEQILNVSVSVAGSGPTGPKGEKGEPGKSPEIRDGFWWTHNNETEKWENTGVEASGKYEIGGGLKLDDATNTLSVDTATDVEEDNTKPITSAAVYQTVGNIEILLGTI